MGESVGSGTGLRLVWSRPEASARPRPRIDLALAIERHLAGEDGLTERQFVVLYATGRALLTPVGAPVR